MLRRAATACCALSLTWYTTLSSAMFDFGSVMAMVPQPASSASPRTTIVLRMFGSPSLWVPIVRLGQNPG
ncbi:hypothetical protein D3C83_217390 [compost metagenome]